MADFLSAQAMAQAGLSPTAFLGGLGTDSQTLFATHGLAMHDALSNPLGVGTGFIPQGATIIENPGGSGFQYAGLHVNGGASTILLNHGVDPTLLAASHGGSSVAGMSRSAMAGITFHHQVVAPTDEQIAAWNDVFEYMNDITGKNDPGFLGSRSQLRESLGIETDSAFNTLIRKVLIQVAQTQRSVRGRRVPGYSLPISPRHKGLLVTDAENAQTISTLYIGPNSLAAATQGQLRGLTPYRVRSRLVRKVVEILQAGASLVGKLETIERGGVEVDDKKVISLAQQIHQFRMLVGDAIAASKVHRYDADPITMAAVMIQAADILNTKVPRGQPGRDDTDLKFKIHDLRVKMDEAYRAASEAERAARTVAARASEVVPSASGSSVRAAVSSRGSASSGNLGGASRRTPRSAESRSSAEAPRFSFEQGVLSSRDYERITTGYYGSAVPTRILIDGVLHEGDDEIDHMYRQTFWESAVRSLSRGRRSSKKVEMVDTGTGVSIPLPEALANLFN
jgi:hypothetical protein